PALMSLPPTLTFTCLFLFFSVFQCAGDHRDLHSFPTRRSSDLVVAGHHGERRGASRAASAQRLDHVAEHGARMPGRTAGARPAPDRKSTRLNSSHVSISYAVFCLKKKNNEHTLLHISSLEPHPL